MHNSLKAMEVIRDDLLQEQWELSYCKCMLKLGTYFTKEGPVYNI